MKLKHLLTGLALFIGSYSFAQTESNVLLTIEDQQITVDEFMAIYNKNNVAIESADKKSIEDYLNLALHPKIQRQIVDIFSF